MLLRSMNFKLKTVTNFFNSFMLPWEYLLFLKNITDFCSQGDIFPNVDNIIKCKNHKPFSVHLILRACIKPDVICCYRKGKEKKGNICTNHLWESNGREEGLHTTFLFPSKTPMKNLILVIQTLFFSKILDAD